MSDSALFYLAEARYLAEGRGDKYSLGYCLNDIGVAYSHAGDHDKAVDHFNQALVIRDDLGDLAGMATTLDNLGKMYALEEKFDQSIWYHYQSLKLSQQLNDSRSMAISQNSVAELLIRQGDFTGAEVYLRKAIATADALKLDSYLEVMRANLVKIFGARQQFDSIDHYFLSKDRYAVSQSSQGDQKMQFSGKPLREESKTGMIPLLFVATMVLLVLLSAVFTLYFRKIS
jgi:tetratricopeptide (TPR) repeat protein